MVWPLRLWQDLPVLVRAVVTGIVVTGAGTVPWVLFVNANVRLSPSVPWAAAAMTVWLYFYWKYWSGAWWPRSTQDLRRERVRSLVLPKQIWGWSLAAGGLAVTTLVALEMLLLRLVHVPVTHRAPPAHTPGYSLLALAAMSAVAAGNPEEVGF